MDRFNLVDEQWLPSVKVDGERREYGLLELFNASDELAELQSASPLVGAAAYRLLLAILHRALDGPQSFAEWSDIFNARKFPAQVERYLDCWRSSFELFDPFRPFYQCAGFELASKRPASQLGHSVAGGNNATLFDHSRDDQPRLLKPAEAARLLIANQAFALGGGTGASSARFGRHPNFAHAPLVGRTVILFKACTLFEALMLNLLPFVEGGPLSGIPVDAPAWESNRMQPGPRRCAGYLDLLTWQSRCVRLLPEAGGIREMYYAQGEIIAADSSPRDPLTMPAELDADAAHWRAGSRLFKFKSETVARSDFGPLSAIMGAGELQQLPPLRCSLTALVNERAKVYSWSQQEFPIPNGLLEHSQLPALLNEAVATCESAAMALRGALGIHDGLETVAEVEHRFWSALEAPFKQLLAACNRDVRSARDAWRRALRSVALDSFRRAIAGGGGGGGGRGRLQTRIAAESYFAGALAELGLAS